MLDKVCCIKEGCEWRLATLLEGVNNKFFEVNFKNLIFYIYGCSRVSKLEIVMLHDSVVKGQSVIMFLY